MSEVTKAKFDKAAQIIQSLPKDGPVKPSTEDQLFFYGYYKQATIGDNISKPKPTGLSGAFSSVLNFDPVGNAKKDAWNKVKGTATEECYQKYVERLIELLKEAGDSESLKKVEELEAA